MFIRSTTPRKETPTERSALLLVSSAVVTRVARRLEDRTSLLDLTLAPAVGAMRGDAPPGRAD